MFGIKTSRDVDIAVLKAWQQNHGAESAEYRAEGNQKLAALEDKVDKGFAKVDTTLIAIASDREKQHRSNSWKMMSILLSMLGSLAIGIGILVMFIFEHWQHWQH